MTSTLASRIDEAERERLAAICPTLYIGLGRTGREVLRSLRQRLIDVAASSPQGTGSLEAFPFNAFLVFDWEKFLTDQGRSASSWASGQLAFSADEVIDCDFSMSKYVREPDSLNRYPIVACWMGSQKRISGLIANIEESDQPQRSSVFARPRWWSRLRIFDAYPKISDQIRNAVSRLASAERQKVAAEDLGFKICADRLRVVVVCSLCGDVGSGSFLDFGWLAGWIARQEIGDRVYVDLVAKLPSALQAVRRPRDGAYAYAALMELETAMRGHSVGRFISQWDPLEKSKLSDRPFDDVYLVEPGTGADQVSERNGESFQMIANALFDDIHMGGYTHKSWLRVHQRRFKMLPFGVSRSMGRYGTVDLAYFKGYSAFGQAELDTQQASRRDLNAVELLAETVDALLGDQSPESKVRTTGDAVTQVKAEIQRETARLRKHIVSGCAMRICIEPPVQARSFPGSEDRRKCVEALASELGDRDALLERLSQPSERAEWLQSAKRTALMQFTKWASASERVDADPLISALSQMSAPERARTFKDWLERSMPQLDTDVTNDFAVDCYQYWTLIGVTDPDGFRRQFGDEIEAVFRSTTAGVRKGNLPQFVSMQVPGRAVCYVELSGIPLAALKDLETWQASYLDWRKRSSDLHTHCDATQFVRPTIPTNLELETLAEDFKYYLLAVMLQVLTPALQGSMPPGQYQLSVRPGETLNMGNERSFRKNGLPSSLREHIIKRVNERIDALGATQLAILAVLASYYALNLYTPRRVLDEAGREEFSNGFAGNVAGEAARELTDRVMRKGLSEREFACLKDRALERLSTWAAPIEGSDSDVYEWEVGKADAEAGPRLKYVVRKEFFHEDADDALAEVLGLRSSSAQQPIKYFLALNGQQAGPYTWANVEQFLAADRINHLTLTWRQGMATWLPLAQLPEFAVPPPLPGTNHD